MNFEASRLYTIYHSRNDTNWLNLKFCNPSGNHIQGIAENKTGIGILHSHKISENHDKTGVHFGWTKM
jgi:hypothetical protein